MTTDDIREAQFELVSAIDEAVLDFLARLDNRKPSLLLLTIPAVIRALADALDEHINSVE